MPYHLYVVMLIERVDKRELHIVIMNNDTDLFSDFTSLDIRFSDSNNKTGGNICIDTASKSN